MLVLKPRCVTRCIGGRPNGECPRCIGKMTEENGDRSPRVDSCQRPGTPWRRSRQWRQICDAISGKCKINCDENDPPGRRLSERPLTPADAAASDTAKESREQSTRARKAIDSHLASQPDLDDAQRSALSYHLERLAAESLWFPEEE